MLQRSSCLHTRHATLRYLLTAALVVGAAAALLRTAADPDLWGHVRFGQDIVAARALPLEDVYSFTADRPWINHEWLAEVLMALAFEGGPLGLNLLRVSIIGAALLIVWRGLQHLEPLVRLQLVSVAAIGILLRVLPIRPQLFSVLLFALTMWLIVRSDRDDSLRPIALMPLVMLAWVNLHGGWIVGLGSLGFWIAARIMTRRVPSGRPVHLAALGLASLLATLVNPYGIEMWRFLAATVRPERAMISDWRPMYVLPVEFAAVWLLPAALVLWAVARDRARVDRTYLALVVLLGVAALRVSRLDAFFTLAAFLLLPPMLAVRSRASDESLDGQDQPRLRLLAVATVGAIVLCLAAWRLPRIEIPSSNPEPEAARYILEHRLEGRMLTWFNWGEYAIWHFGPRIRVSMDGRRETVYSDAVTADHLAFYSGAREAVSYPDRIGADYIWLPRKLPVVPQLQASGWQTIFSGPASVLLTRSSRFPLVQSSTRNTYRLFPGK